MTDVQMSPLLGIAAVNSLLFTAYGASRRIVSPYPDLSIAQVALAGSMAGAFNAVLASPVNLRPEGPPLMTGRDVQDPDAGPVWRRR